MPDKAARKPPGWVRAVVALICGSALVTLLVSFDGMETGSWWLLKALAFVVFLFMLVGYVYFRHGRLLQQTSRHSEVVRLPDTQPLKLQRSAGTDLVVTPAQAKLFASTIIAPADSRLRVVEVYEPSQRSLQHRLTVDARVPAAGPPSPVLFPVTVAPKGELSDNFSLTGRDGERVTSLTYREYLQLTARVLRTLLIAAYALKENEELPQDAVDAERSALNDIMQRGVPGQFSNGGAAELGRLTVPDPESLALARTLTEKLSAHYAIVADTTPDARGNISLTLQRTVIPTLLVSDGENKATAWIKGVARILLGARPVALQIPIAAAGTAQSYHLIVQSEDGLYLAQQDCPEIDDFLTKRRADPSASPIAPPYYRFRRRLGQTYAHFYARFFPEYTPDHRPPKLKVLFFETPPGSTFRALVAALASAVLVWAVGIGVSRGQIQDLGTDAPAILLAFPAIAAAWLGFDRPARRLLEGTMTSRLSLALTAAVSVLGSALFVLHRSRVPLPNISGHLQFSVLFVNRPSWAFLILLACLNALFIGYFYVVRSLTFMQLASRQTARESEDIRITQGG